MNSNNTKAKSRLVDAILIIAAMAVLYLFYRLVGCPIKFFTGISCAGCGMTRAWISVLHGHFETAFHYHPLFPTVPVALMLFLIRDYLPEKVKYALLFVFVALFLVVYGIRMADPNNTIVVFAPRRGLIFRFWRIIGELFRLILRIV